MTTRPQIDASHSEQFSLAAGVYRIALEAGRVELQRIDHKGRPHHVASVAAFAITGTVAPQLGRAVRKATQYLPRKTCE